MNTSIFFATAAERARAAGDVKFARFLRILAAERDADKVAAAAARDVARVLSYRQRLVLAINKPGRVTVESVAIRQARELLSLTARAEVYAMNHPRGRAVFSFNGVL